MSVTASPSRRLLPLLVVTALFLLGVGGAWAWFHVGTRTFTTFHEITPRASVPGFTYVADLITEGAADILATTNAINGRFTNAAGGRFTVFFGDWRARSAREMNVVQHTPDICWVGAGWVPVPLERPLSLELEFGGVKLPFECRAFRAPQGRHLELAAWCTLVSGQAFEEGERFTSEDDASRDKRDRFYAAGRRVARDHFFRVLRERIPGDGTKQFVRFSMALGSDPEKSLQELKRFGEAWLELQVRPTAPQ